AQQDYSAASFDVALVLRHDLIAASIVDGVIHCRAASGPQHPHAPRERFRIVGEALSDLGSRVETQHECLVLLVNDLVQKLDGGFLFELEAIANRVAGINQQAYTKRQIRFAAE